METIKEGQHLLPNALRQLEKAVEVTGVLTAVAMNILLIVSTKELPPNTQKEQLNFYKRDREALPGEEMNNIYYGMDFANGPSQTVITVWYCGRAYGKTFLSRLWLQCHYSDLLSKQLIRRLAAEAILTVSLTS
jgi:hypothetical protein